MINKVIRNINKSNIRIPARIMIMTPTVAIMKTATAEPNISAMA
jgi:Na+-translocating ferredoxin:NAD+ oxidoreductase RnfE subunit